MPSFACIRNPRELGAPWCSARVKFGACRVVWLPPHSVLGATTSSPGADANAHLLHRDLRGGGDSEVELPVKWEQRLRKEKALLSFISSGVWLGWCGLPLRRCWALQSFPEESLCFWRACLTWELWNCSLGLVLTM